MDKANVCIIRAKLKKDYVFDAIGEYGYQIKVPYKGNELLPRIFREIWFRGKLPKKELWYNKSVNGYSEYVVFDPLISPDYLDWLKRNNPDAGITLNYENRASKTIDPNKTDPAIRKWSYDKEDCEKYGMSWSRPSFFSKYRIAPDKNAEIDVLYVGRDKGRAQRLFEIEKMLNCNGLKTYFHICADRKFLRFKKRYYKKLLDYDEYLQLLSRSKAVLNIVPEGQKSITQREMEAAFDGIKCITNNEGVKEFELYDPSIYFVLGTDPIEEIKSFMETPVKKHPDDVLTGYDFENRLTEMLEE